MGTIKVTARLLYNVGESESGVHHAITCANLWCEAWDCSVQPSTEYGYGV